MAVAGNRVAEIRVAGDLAVAAGSPEAGEVEFTFLLAAAVRLLPHVAESHRRTTIEHPRLVSRIAADQCATDVRLNRRFDREPARNWVLAEINPMAEDLALFSPMERGESTVAHWGRMVSLARILIAERMVASVQELNNSL